MASNLPPGVSISDIPGNRPEDLEEEEFWAEFTRKCHNEGIAGDIIDCGWEDDEIFSRAIIIARDLGYSKGQADAEADAALIPEE
jgi:hypothetical protein